MDVSLECTRLSKTFASLVATKIATNRARLQTIRQDIQDSRARVLEACDKWGSRRHALVQTESIEMYLRVISVETSLEPYLARVLVPLVNRGFEFSGHELNSHDAFRPSMASETPYSRTQRN